MSSYGFVTLAMLVYGMCINPLNAKNVKAR